MWTSDEPPVADQTLRIAVSAPYYTPAVRAGGPVPGVLGVVHSLTGHNVRVFTGDRDLGDEVPYPPPHVGTVDVNGKSVTYLSSPGIGSGRQWLRALRAMHSADILYLNSCLSAAFTMLPLCAMRITRFRGRLVISPRGELAETALRLGRSGLKRAWLPVLRWLLRPTRATGTVVWLASSQHEANDIKAHFPAARVAISAEQLRTWHGDFATPRGPEEGPLRLISVGRLAPIKGTLKLVRAAAACAFPLRLTLVGPDEDPEYSAEVHRAAARCPEHVKIIFTGTTPPEQVRSALLQADLFISLTQGENFGHAIGEALQMGLPAIITDRTPWNFAAESGAVVLIPLEEASDPARVAAAIGQFAMKPKAERARLSEAAIDVATGLQAAPGNQTLLDAVRQLSR